MIFVHLPYFRAGEITLKLRFMHFNGSMKGDRRAEIMNNGGAALTDIEVI